jgi:hypothetical protein
MVDIDREGKIVVETANRGEALTRWIAKLQGKKTMVAVSDDHGTVEDDDSDPESVS